MEAEELPDDVSVGDLIYTPRSALDLPPENAADLLPAVETMRGQLDLLSRLLRTKLDSRPHEDATGPSGGAEASDSGDQLLDVEAVAEVLNVDERYVYDHADDWPFTRRISPRKLRFSEKGLYRWIDSRP